MRGIGFLLCGAVVLVSVPAPAQGEEPPTEWLGRRNPYRPLVVPKREPASFPAPPAERETPARLTPKPESVLDRLEYVGIAYDETEAIAAVSDGDRTWFVRMGDRLDGAAVSAITPHKLTWSRKGREIVKHLRREGVR